LLLATHGGLIVHAHFLVTRKTVRMGFSSPGVSRILSQAVINRRLESHDSKKSKDFAVAANC